jgi:tetratricopeptide (TPR) repeat protein
MAAAPAIAEAFTHLQAGDAARALEVSRRIAAAEPSNARAHLAAGIALRLLGRLPESQAALDLAASLDPRDYAVAYESAVVRELRGDSVQALAQFHRAAQLRPAFFAAHFSAGLLHFKRREWADAIASFREASAIDPANIDALLNLGQALCEQGDLGHHAEAEDAYTRALAADPDHFLTLRTFGRYSVSRGNYARAAKLFAAALRRGPTDEALPMFLAQVELLLGNWDAAWQAYARREPRLDFERAMSARGSRYAVPPLAELADRDVTLVAEQGLGDILFFLRFAPVLKAAGARLRFAGAPRLHSLLARCGWFESLHADASAAAVSNSLPILIADLPSLDPGEGAPFRPSLRIGADPDRIAKWRKALEAAGPRPWVGATWRAGTPLDQVAHALSKTVPLEAFFEALAPWGGTVVALQRGVEAGELQAAGRALGGTVHDFSRANEDLEDMLALVSLLDRHAGMSNTNMHLAAAAGATADVLVPFPPEWRWRAEGGSPWFPGFRVHRQSPEGDWSTALRSLSR